MRYLLFLSIAVLCFGCDNEKLDLKECPEMALKNGTISNEEEYDIVETVFEEFYSGVSEVHINQLSSQGYSDYDIMESFIPDSIYAIDSTVYSQYATKNDTNYVWGQSLEVGGGLTHPEELSCYSEGSGTGWENYYNRFEESIGYLEFSRPVITVDGKALLEYGWYCGSLCGMGYIVILEREEGTWKVVHRTATWAI